MSYGSFDDSKPSKKATPVSNVQEPTDGLTLKKMPTLNRIYLEKNKTVKNIREGLKNFKKNEGVFVN